MGELVLWCGMFAPKGRLEWYRGLARGAPCLCPDAELLSFSSEGGGDSSWEVYDLPIEVIAREVRSTTRITQESLDGLTGNREETRGSSIVAHLARVISGYMVIA